MKLFTKDINGKQNRSASSPAKKSPSFNIQEEFDNFYDFFTQLCFTAEDNKPVKFEEEKAENILEPLLAEFCKESNIDKETAKRKFLSSKRTGNPPSLLESAMTKKSPEAIQWLKSMGCELEIGTLHYLSADEKDKATTHAVVNTPLNPGLRQALEFERAQQEARIKKLEDDLAIKERTIGEQTSKIQQLELKQATEKKQAEEKLTQVTKELAEALEEATKHHAVLAAKEGELTAQNAALQDAHQQLQTTTQQQLADAATTNQQLQAQVSLLAKEQGEVVATQTKQITELQQKQAALEKELQQQRDTTNDATTRVEAKAAELQETQHTLAAKQQELADVVAKSAKQAAIQAELTAQVTALKSSNAELEKQLQQTQQALSTKEKELAEKTTAHQTERDELKQQLSGVQTQLESANSLNTTNAAQLALSRQEAETHKVNLAAMQQELATTTAESIRQKTVIAENKRLFAEQQQTIEQQTAAQADLAAQHKKAQTRNVELEMQLQKQIEAATISIQTNETIAATLRETQQTLAAREQTLVESQQQLANAAIAQQQLQTRLETLAREKGDTVAEQTDQITQLQQQRADLETQLRIQTEATRNAAALADTKTAKLEEVKQTLTTTQQALTTVRAEAEQLKAEVDSATQTIAQQSTTQIESAAQNTTLAKRIAELETSLGDEKANHQQLQTTSQQQLSDAAAKQAALENQLSGIQTQLASANNLNATDAAQLAQLQQEMAAQKASLADTQQALATAVAESTQLRTAIAENERLLTERQQTTEAQSRTQADLAVQNAALAQRNNELEQTLGNEQASKTQLQATSTQQLVLEAAKQKKLQGQLDAQEKEIVALQKKLDHAKKKSEKFETRVTTLKKEAESQSRITEALNKNLAAKTKEYNDLRRKVNRHKKKKASIGEHDIEFPAAPSFRPLPSRCSDAFKQVVFNFAAKGDGNELMFLLSAVGADALTDEKRGSLLAATIPNRNIQAAHIIRRFTYDQKAITAAYSKLQENVTSSTNPANAQEFTRLLLSPCEHPFYRDFVAKKYASLKGEAQKDYFDTNAWIDGDTLLHTAARLEDAGLIRIAFSLGIDIDAETLEEEGLTASGILLQRGKHTENLPECFSILVDHQPLAFNKTRLKELLGQSWIESDTKQAIDTKLQEPSPRRQANHLLHYLCIKHCLEQISDSDQQERLKKLFQAYKPRMAIFLPNQPTNTYEIKASQERADKEFIESLLASEDIDETEKLCCETLMLYIDPYIPTYNPQQLAACRARHNHALAELIQQLINQGDDSLLKILFENKELFATTGTNPIDPLSLKIEDKDIIEYAIDKHAYLVIELLSTHYKERFTAKLIKQIITYAMDKHAYPLIDMLLKKNILKDDDKKELLKLAVPTDAKEPAYPLVGLQLVQTVQDKDIKKKYTERVLAAVDSHGDAAVHLAIKFISPSSLSFIVNQGEQVRDQEFSKSDGCGNTVLELYRYLDDLKKCVTAELKADIESIQKLLLEKNPANFKVITQEKGSAQSAMFPPATPRSNHAGLRSQTTTPRKPSAKDDDDDSESVSFSDSVSLSDSNISQSSTGSQRTSSRPPSTPKT